MADVLRALFPGLGRNRHVTWRAAQRVKPLQLVQRDPRAYWEQKTWVSRGHQFDGWFRTPYGSWKGRADRTPSGTLEVYIQNPPTFIDSSPHRSCIQDRGGGWHFIHVTNGVSDLSSAIIHIEHLLVEAFMLYRRSGRGIVI